MPPNVPNVPSGGTPLGQRYLLHEAIGRGAMGSVYRATRRDTGEELAAKVLHPELADDRSIVARFVQEGAILTGIRDPHVVAVRDLVVDGETLAILSDLVNGTDLRRYLRTHGPLPAAAAAGIAAQILRGLAAGHAGGVIHRDIKPENVLVDSPGSGPPGPGSAPPLVRVTDFGVARLAGTAGLTRMTSLIGTPDYMAPEMAVPSPVTEKVDVYGAGVVLYELLCGVTPFAGPHPMAVLKAHTERLPGRIPGVPDELWNVLRGMLAKDPAGRPTAAAAATQLEGLVPALSGVGALPRLAEAPPSLPVSGDGGGSATLLRGFRPPPGPGPAPTPVDPAVNGPAGPSRRDGRRRRAFLISAAALLAALLAAAGIAAFGGGGAPVHVSFPVAIVGGNLAVHRSYELDGDTLTTKVRLTSIATSTADVSFSEVVPESVARSVTGLRDVQPANPRVLQADPVLLFSFTRVSPGDTREISYRATVTGSDPPATRLARLEGDQQAAEASFDRQNAIVVSQLQTLTITPAAMVIPTGQSVTVTLAGTLDSGGSAPAQALAAVWTSSRPDVVTVDGTTLSARRRPPRRPLRPHREAAGHRRSPRRPPLLRRPCSHRPRRRRPVLLLPRCPHRCRPSQRHRRPPRRQTSTPAGLSSPRPTPARATVPSAAPWPAPTSPSSTHPTPATPPSRWACCTSAGTPTGSSGRATARPSCRGP
ncbi:MAG: serine/threonine protein kinase [Actinobacteria bacterium]|nr:MAG: serine/threonine protein kinase [Actinomycetota bacterium]